MSQQTELNKRVRARLSDPWFWWESFKDRGWVYFLGGFIVIAWILR